MLEVGAAMFSTYYLLHTVLTALSRSVGWPCNCSDEPSTLTRYVQPARLAMRYVI